MSFHYDATSDFHTSIAEVETLLTLASSDDTNRTMFLKLSMVSLVTKFQVFVEKILQPTPCQAFCCGIKGDIVLKVFEVLLKLNYYSKNHLKCNLNFK